MYSTCTVSYASIWTYIFMYSIDNVNAAAVCRVSVKAQPDILKSVKMLKTSKIVGVIAVCSDIRPQF